MKKSVTVTIDDNGNPSIEVNGVAGKSCTELTKDLERKLGIESKPRTIKPEYNRSGNVAMKQEQR